MDVVSGSAEEEVRRVHAWRIVAVVEDPQAVRDRPVGQFPGDAMRWDGPFTDAVPDLPVPGPVGGRCPEPARPEVRRVLGCRAVLVDLRPEPLSDRLTRRH